MYFKNDFHFLEVLSLMNQKSLKDLVDEELPNPSLSKTSMRDLLENAKHSNVDVIENATRSNSQFALQSNFNNQIIKSNPQIYLPQNSKQCNGTNLNPTNFEHRKSQPTFHSNYYTTQQSIDQFTINNDFFVGFSNPKHDSKTTKEEKSDDEFEIHLDDGTDHIHFEINQSDHNDTHISFHNSPLSNFNHIESNRPNNHSINESDNQIDLFQKREESGQICFQNVLDKPFNNQFIDSQNENSLRSHFLKVDHQFSGDSNRQQNNNNSLFDENDSTQMINQDEKWSPDVSLFDTIQAKPHNPMLKETTSNEQHLILLNKSEPNLFLNNSAINQNDSIDIQFPSDFLSVDDISIQQRRGTGLPAAFGFGSQELEREYYSQKPVNKPNVDMIDAHINPENDISDDKIEIYTPKNEFSEGFVFPEFEQSSKYELTNEIHLDFSDEESSNEINQNSEINSKDDKIINENKHEIKLDLKQKENKFKHSFDGFTFQSASNDNTNEIHLDLSEEELHENSQQDQKKTELKENEFQPSFDDFQFNDQINKNTNEIHLDIPEEDFDENDQLDDNNVKSKEIEFKPSFDSFPVNQANEIKNDNESVFKSSFDDTSNENTKKIHLDIQEEDLNESDQQTKNHFHLTKSEFKPSFDDVQYNKHTDNSTNEIKLDLSEEEDKNENQMVFKHSFDELSITNSSNETKSDKTEEILIIENSQNEKEIQHSLNEFQPENHSNKIKSEENNLQFNEEFDSAKLNDSQSHLNQLINKSTQNIETKTTEIIQPQNAIPDLPKEIGKSIENSQENELNIQNREIKSIHSESSKPFYIFRRPLQLQNLPFSQNEIHISFVKEKVQVKSIPSFKSIPIPKETKNIRKTEEIERNSVIDYNDDFDLINAFSEFEQEQQLIEEPKMKNAIEEMRSYRIFKQYLESINQNV